MIEVKVTLPLRIRKGPGRGFGIIGTVEPSGKSIMMDGMEDKENYKGVSQWYYKFNDKKQKQWYWGGRLSLVAAPSAPPLPITRPVPDYFNLTFLPDKMSWAHQRFDLPSIWKDLKTAGKQITVAVVDTGIDTKHDDLKNIHPLSKSFVEGDDSLTDSDGHGTNMAGMIGATGLKSVFGVAPQVKLLVVKGTPVRNGVNLKKFAEAINYAASINEVDIVSISYSFLIDEPDIKAAVQNCLAAKKIVVAAIGNGRNDQFPTDDDTFPACYNTNEVNKIGVVAVGAFDINGEVCGFSNANKHLTLLAPGDFSVLTAAMGNVAGAGSGTSIATAFTAGFIALLLSRQKNNPPAKANPVDAIVSSADDMDPNGFDVRSGFGRINLRNAISQIK